MMCDAPWAPIIHKGVGTPLSSSLCSWVRLIHLCTSNQAMRSHPCWWHITQRVYHGWMDENWHTSCYCRRWHIMYHELQPFIQVISPLSIHQWMHLWVCFTIIHTTRARASYPYWLRNTPRMNHGWMDENLGTLLAPAWDGVWCTMSSNHQCRHWHPSQFISGYMGEVDTQLYKQPSKGILSILATQHSKDGPAWIK